MPDITVPADPTPPPTRTVSVTFPFYAKRTSSVLVQGMPQVTREFFRAEDLNRARVITLAVIDRDPQADIPVHASIERRPTSARQLVHAFEGSAGLEISNESEYLAAQAEAVTIFQALRVV